MINMSKTNKNGSNDQDKVALFINAVLRPPSLDLNVICMDVLNLHQVLAILMFPDYSL